MGALRLLPLVAVIPQVWNGVVGREPWPHRVALATSLVLSIASFFVLFHEDADEE